MTPNAAISYLAFTPPIFETRPFRALAFTTPQHNRSVCRDVFLPLNKYCLCEGEFAKSNLKVLMVIVDNGRVNVWYVCYGESWQKDCLVLRGLCDGPLYDVCHVPTTHNDRYLMWILT
jgi:hypothetical protein